jgi:hypothetical protein
LSNRRNNRLDVRDTYEKKIVTCDSLFKLPSAPKEIWEPPPNSFTLLLAFLIAGGAKKIIVFGLDGVKQGQHILGSYYQEEIVKAERRMAFGDERTGSVVSDAHDFITRWPKIFQTYKTAFNNLDVEIVNCSPVTIFECFRKIDYSDLEKEL